MLKISSNTLLPDTLQNADNLELLSLVMDDELTAKKLYNERHDLFRAISAPCEELKVYGLSEKTISKLKAAIELGRRMYIHRTSPLFVNNIKSICCIISSSSFDTSRTPSLYLGSSSGIAYISLNII